MLTIKSSRSQLIVTLALRLKALIFNMIALNQPPDFFALNPSAISIAKTLSRKSP
jgi:hypothetical protein